MGPGAQVIDVVCVTPVELIQDSLDCDRLRVDSQPIMDLATGELSHEELLVRMVTEDGRVLMPGRFMPVAELNGMLPRIDRFMVERAAALAAQGRAVHVNLSATTLAAGSFYDDVIAAVERCGADPALITFEITETAAAADMFEAGCLARRLSDHGFQIAIDDFGSGWGALRYLQKLPVSTIKIDREFITDFWKSPAATNLVRGIVALARELGLRVVGEGVEDEQTLQLMRELGINYAQGYHIGRPAPVESIARTVARAA